MGPSAAAPVGRVMVVSSSTVVVGTTVVTEVVALVVTEVETLALAEVVVVVWAMARAAKREKRAAVTFIDGWRGGVGVGERVDKRRRVGLFGPGRPGGVAFYWAAENEWRRLEGKQIEPS